MSTIVGFISEKGGVGKTTACYHIAIAQRVRDLTYCLPTRVSLK